jgi:hypothetical protein
MWAIGCVLCEHATIRKAAAATHRRIDSFKRRGSTIVSG